VLGWVVLSVAAAVCLWRGYPAGRWFVFGLILLLPSSSFLPAADLVAWRRLYLPMTAFSLAIAWVLPRRALLPRLAIFTVPSAARAIAWRDEAGSWREAAAAAPGKLRPRSNCAARPACGGARAAGRGRTNSAGRPGHRILKGESLPAARRGGPRACRVRSSPRPATG
jgi:hypothetical protein